MIGGSSECWAKRRSGRKSRRSGTPNKFKSAGIPSIRSRFGNARSGGFSAHGPTKTQRQQFAIAKDEYKAVEAEIRVLLEEAVPALMKKLDEAGVPWSKGRPLPASNGR